MEFLHLETRFNQTVLLFYFLMIAILFGGAWFYWQHKNAKIATDIYVEKSRMMNAEVSTLIERKKHATRLLAVSLAKNNAIIDALVANDPERIDLTEVSIDFRKNTDFKNVWIQIVSADGHSFKRSWTDKRADDLLRVRTDLRRALIDPRIVSVISVGKFDMTFITIIPLYRDGVLVGLLEIITHFNSIDRMMQERGYRSIVLADDRYKKQLEFAYTGKFVNDFYVANLDADEALMDRITPYVSGLKRASEPFFIDKSSEWFFSFLTISDVSSTPMGYYILATPMNSIDLRAIEVFKKRVASVTAIIFVLVSLLFYRMIDRQKLPENLATHTTVRRLIVTLSLLFVVILSVIFMVLSSKHEQRVDEYLAGITERNVALYTLAYGKYKDIAETLYRQLVRNEQAIAMVERAESTQGKARDAARQALYQNLLGWYEQIKELHVRQLHFHLNDNISFLRFHRPNKFGDDLTDVRYSVRMVNATLKPMYGFEEGRVYNGYRFVFPLFSRSNVHIGSVEISFSGYAIMQEFEALHALSVNLLLPKSDVNARVFSSEKGNYADGLLEGFVFDKSVLAKMKSEILELKYDDPKLLRDVLKKINAGRRFSVYLSGSRHIDTYIPVHNPVTNRMAACLVIRQRDKVVERFDDDFYFLLLTFFFLFVVIMTFVFREMLGRHIIGNINEILDHKVTHDVLTGAYSREFVYTRFDAIVTHCQYGGCRCAVVLMDIDYFKRVNDVFGHDVGDRVLCELTDLIMRSLRSDDYFIRWGGEEFLILMYVHDLDSAVRAIESVRKTIAAHPFKDIERLTCSFGVTLHERNESMNVTLKRVDEALYMAKERGRNCVCRQG